MKHFRCTNWPEIEYNKFIATKRWIKCTTIDTFIIEWNYPQKPELASSVDRLREPFITDLLRWQYGYSRAAQNGTSIPSYKHEHITRRFTQRHLHRNTRAIPTGARDATRCVFEGGAIAPRPVYPRGVFTGRGPWGPDLPPPLITERSC